MGAKKVTLKEVAARSGVSLATACRVLTNNGYPVSEEIRERVLNAARELHYHTNGAPALANEVAVVIPTVSNLFYTALITGVESVLAKENYSALVYDMDSIPAAGADEFILQSALSKGVRGIIAASPRMYGVLHRNVQRLKDQRVAVTLADCPVSANDFSSIFYDYKRGATLGAEYLIKMGHRRIAYAGMPLERESRSLRVQGFREAIQAAGLTEERCPVLTYQGERMRDNRQIEAGAEMAEQILQMMPRPTAVFAMNDMVAFGMLRCFRRERVRVPEEISVLGFDDSPFAELVTPGLTTVRVQSEQMGRMAAMLLLETIRGPGRNAVQLSIEPGIVERETAARPGGSRFRDE